MEEKKDFSGVLVSGLAKTRDILYPGWTVFSWLFKNRRGVL